MVLHLFNEMAVLLKVIRKDKIRFDKILLISGGKLALQQHKEKI